MKLCKVFVPIAFVACLLSTEAAASIEPAAEHQSTSPLILSGDQDSYDLDHEVEVLLDAPADTRFEDLISGAFQGEFVSFEHAELSNQQGLWLRLEIENQADRDIVWLLVYENYRVNEIAVYLPDPKGGYREVRTGNSFSFSTRDIEFHYYVFELNLDPGDSGTIYLYLEDVSGLIPLYPLKIESLEHFSESAFVQNFWSGAYYLFIITILIYSILFVFSLQDRRVISYAVFLLTVILISIAEDGYGHQFVWPDNVFLAEHSIRLFALLYLVALLNFTIVMLDIANYYPRWANISKWFMLAALLVIGIRWIPAANTLFFNYLTIGFLIIGFLLPILVAARLVTKNRRLSLLFLLAFAGYLGLIIMTLLNTVWGMEVVSGTQANRIAFAWVLIVFTFINNEQIGNMRREREKVQQELLVEKEDALRVQLALTKLMEQSRDNILDAYDTTLEGWAHLLEVRDKETEGHSRRVIDLTVQLARQLGVEENELIHIRRGALLHDIGKIAVPDNILLKPGPLTDAEWEVMKRHPLHAHEALSRIPYLEKSMDIPVYHHENWDGSGYPYGLAGEQIPLAARIFTIVDNWEALLSDRPYRAAWPYPKVMDYLRQQAGKKFDPHILPEFIRLVDDLGYYV